MKSVFPTLILVLFLLAETIDACTTFVVGSKATKDGSVMATHTNDGGGTTDPRLVKIPSRDYPEGSKRPIFSSPENYPRYVGNERNAPQYYPEHCQAGTVKCKPFEPIGFIPQVNHTFAYFEATYGIMNEYQVAISESTCSGVFAASSLKVGGKALLSIDQLSQIAMERATSAREAVLLMGSLAEEYGFYGESNSFEGGSESLIVTDPKEGWVFHILADPTGSSAIWAAARVPDDSVAVVANMFSIREIDLNDSANFLGRSDMWEIAEQYELWEKTEPKDFTRTFSDGEYAHKYYSGRRMWGVFNLLAPSQHLPSEYDNLKQDKPYPFAVPVDSLVGPQDMMTVLRYWYNGTVYSTGDGLAGGPFGTPDRYSGGSGESVVQGNWERTIALFRSSDTYVVQSRPYVPNTIGGVIWFGPAAAHATNYVPVLSSMDVVPDCLKWGWQGVYNMSSTYWVQRVILNVAQIKFNYMIEDIRSLQTKLENESLQLLEDINSGKYIGSAISDEMVKNAEKARVEFTELINYLLYTYADGYLNYWKDGLFHSQSVGYPAWWLEQVGYPNGPPPVDSKTAKLAKQRYLNSLDRTQFEADQNRHDIIAKQAAHIQQKDSNLVKQCAMECHSRSSNTKESFEHCLESCF